MTRPSSIDLRDAALLEVRQAIINGNFDRANAQLAVAKEQQERAKRQLRVTMDR